MSFTIPIQHGDIMERSQSRDSMSTVSTIDTEHEKEINNNMSSNRSNTTNPTVPYVVHTNEDSEVGDKCDLFFIPDCIGLLEMILECLKVF